MSNDDVIGLVLRAKDGDDDAFAEICGIYSRLLDSAAAGFAQKGRDYGDIRDDLRQEASMALYRAVTTFDCSQDKVTFGLYAKICINNALVSQLRKLRAANRKSSQSTGQAQEGVESAVITEEMRRLFIRRAEGKLSVFEMTALLMSMDGQRPRHIAKELGVSAKCVSNALFRAREKLRGDPGFMQ